MYRRSKDVEAEATEENGDPLSGSADPFDALINSKPDESSSRSNGKRAPSPIPDDSDTENDNEPKNDDDKSETNGESADSADNDNVGDEGYEVEAIVDHKFKGKKKFFKIRWKNYDETQDTWEPEAELSCPDIIERYLEEHPEAQGPKKPAKEKKVSKYQLLFIRPCRWHEFNSTDNGVLLKVRISLPPSRLTPKRTAAERKVIIDDPLSDGEESEKKKASPGKRGRPKNSGAKGKGGKSTEEYEVQKIIDDEMRGSKKYYRIRWKGWSAKDDTWEPKSSLSCPDIIKAYENSKEEEEEEEEQDYEVEKIVGEKIEYGVRYFLVKWKGWSEKDNTWEKEDGVDCYELIEKFRDSCRSPSKSNKRPAKSSPKTSKTKKARKIASDTEEDEGDDDEDEKEWEVEKVVNQRTGKGGKKEYLIRWKGCKASDDTWEPEEGVNSPELIAAFIKKNKK